MSLIKIIAAIFLNLMHSIKSSEIILANSIGKPSDYNIKIILLHLDCESYIRILRMTSRKAFSG
jgi:hypothetical protein